jgi:hypothetical protein
MLLGALDFYMYCDVIKDCSSCHEVDPALALSSPLRKNREYFSWVTVVQCGSAAAIDYRYDGR